MRVPKMLVPVLAVGLLLGTVAAAQANGYWIVSGRQMVDVTHLSSGDDVRGWMTLEQVAAGLGIDEEDLYSLLAIPADIPPATALKDLEPVLPDFEVTTVRDAVNAHLGLAAPQATESQHPDVETPEPAIVEAAPAPTEPAETRPQPEATARPAAVEPQPAATEAHAPGAGAAGMGEGTGSGPAPLPAGEVLAAAAIKGRHTLAQIADEAAVDLDALLEALDLPPDTDTSASLKTLVEAGVVAEIDVVRDAVARLQAP